MPDDEPTIFESASPSDAAPTRRRRSPAKKTTTTTDAAPAFGEAPAAAFASAPESGATAPPPPRKRAAKKPPEKKPPAKNAKAGDAAGETASGAGSGGEAAVGVVPPNEAAQPAAKAEKAPAKRASRARKTASADVGAASGAGADGANATSAAGAYEPARGGGIPTVLFQAPQADAAPARPKTPRARGGAAASVDASADRAESRDVGEAAEMPSGEDGEREGPRRRRRGGRGRRGGHGDGHAEGRDEHETAGAAGDADLAAPAASEDKRDDGDQADEHDGDGSSRRRRRRRRRGSNGELEDHAPDDPPNTVVRVREPREHDGRGVQGVKGSTRLEAKKQRRREGREQIRRGRRGLVITEAEFLARRESVDRVMVVRQRGDRTQIGVVEDGILVEHFVSTAAANRLVGNVYLGRVQNVLPGMEAAFVDIGKGRNAVLYAGEVNFDMSGMEGQPRRIEQALKGGQPVLVQVTKDAIGHKGARLTSQVSLPGRYLVYVPEGSMMGISRKLPDVERSRLKSILKKVMPEGAGVIVRTAAEGASEDELSRDVARLSAQWEDIKKKSETANAPSLLYGEPDLTIRVIRDVFNEDFNSLVVQAESEWDTVEAYVGHVAPDLVSRLSRWTSEEDVFTHYRVEEQLAKALDRKVWLPSGGYLVIDRTEAMIVIDVNTGRFIGKGGNLEETVTKNNLEAAEEIVRQLRLRDIGGIIVIDFIDMVLESNRELVLRRLVECLGRDRTKHQVAEVTSLGLVQMTRKRVGNGLLEAFSEVCETCNGRGVIVHTDPVEHRPPRPATPKPAPARAGSGKAGSGNGESGKASSGRGSSGRGGRGKRAVAGGDGAVGELAAVVEDTGPRADAGATSGASVHDNGLGGAAVANGAAEADDAGAASASHEGAQASSSGSRTRRGGRRRSKHAAASADGSAAGAPTSESLPV